ncbi:hypothetical protein [Mariniflexile sp.]|uniref:hypothetical protein n=1 Tax=Mariniflexile sp. TaxID=1979402 RepID=UPI004048BBFC
MLFLKYKKSSLTKTNIFVLILLLFICSKTIGQSITYSTLTLTSDELKTAFIEDSNYFSGGNNDLPYFQSKNGNLSMRYYKSTGVIVIFDFKSKSDYISLIREIQKNAYFRFKYCTDYDEPITYNYETYNDNKIRFDFSEMRISVEYPSKVNSFLDSNSDFTTVFVCMSKGAYAFHTNLKCEGLANCDAEIAKSNIREAKKYDYRFCEICTDDE